MRTHLPLICALAAAVTAASGAAHALSPEARTGRAVMERAQCTRCHDVTDAAGLDRGIAAAPRELHCVDCHSWILDTRDDPDAKAHMRETFPDWDRYVDNVVHYTRLPDLGTLTRRVRPSFVRGYLDAPHDLRPHLDESMIPLRLDAAEKDAVVAYLSELNGDLVAHDPETPTPPPSPERVARGRELFINGACPSCHVRGAEQAQPSLDRGFYESMRPVALLAPNLRFVAQRIPRETLVRYIIDPPALDPQIAMPTFAISAEDAALLADYLLFGDVAWDDRVREAAPAEVPLLDRPVTFDEVYDEVIGRVCIHCHMNPEANGGEGGPGNTGGLGFEGSGLDLESWEGLLRGVRRDGEWRSILESPAPGEPPLLLASVLRRRTEAARDLRLPYADAPDATEAVGPDLNALGMPLGLPPLSDEHVSLVKTWLAQGAPGPTSDWASTTR